MSSRSRGPSKRTPARLPDWERVLAAAARLQGLLPDAVLVGGSAAALHAGHRISVDADHVLIDLRDRFDGVLAELESVAGWRTARVKRPVLILGSLDDIETGALAEYKHLQPEWHDWQVVSRHAAKLAVTLFDRLCER